MSWSRFIMTAISGYIVLGCWIIFAAYWLINARRVKVTAERQGLWSALAHRIPLGVSYLLLAAWNGGAGVGGAKIAIGHNNNAFTRANEFVRDVTCRLGAGDGGLHLHTGIIGGALGTLDVGRQLEQ